MPLHIAETALNLPSTAGRTRLADNDLLAEIAAGSK